MVSYASEGGGVGPHTDRYDVFLLQGPGKRRWRLQSRGPIVVDERGAVPTVQDFRPEEEHVLEAGDLLYLPPGVVHDGVAVGGPCLTYSIGAVAPSVEGLLQNYVAFMSQRIEATVDLAQMYEDGDRTPQSSPAAIDDAMVRRVQGLLTPVVPDADTVAVFVGRLLTGPKPGVAFRAPAAPPSASVVDQLCAARAVVRLDRAARALVRPPRVFIAGEAYNVDDHAWWAAFCDARSAPLSSALGPASRAALRLSLAAGSVVRA
jgi:50S ribosomal protein L16 3-hydroxylase